VAANAVMVGAGVDARAYRPSIPVDRISVDNTGDAS
jgi:hypothetical protein